MSDSQNTVSALFGPLPKDFCLYFYILTVVNFIVLILFIVSSLFIGITEKKKMGYFIQILSIGMVYLVVYFQNRLMSTICYSAIE